MLLYCTLLRVIDARNIKILSLLRILSLKGIDILSLSGRCVLTSWQFCTSTFNLTLALQLFEIQK